MSTWRQGNSAEHNGSLSFCPLIVRPRRSMFPVLAQHVIGCLSHQRLKPPALPSRLCVQANDILDCRSWQSVFVLGGGWYPKPRCPASVWFDTSLNAFGTVLCRLQCHDGASRSTITQVCEIQLWVKRCNFPLFNSILNTKISTSRPHDISRCQGVKVSIYLRV